MDVAPLTAHRTPQCVYIGILIVAAGSLVISVAIFIPVGIFKTVGESIGSLIGRPRDVPSHGDGKPKCVVVTGASSGIGAALAMEYARPATHLVLIARDLTRLNHVAMQCKAAGATTEVHSIDLFDPANMAKLYRLLQDIDARYTGIELSILCMGVTAHRSDVLGKDLSHIPPLDSSSAPDVVKEPMSKEDGEFWGATSASRMLQVNVAASQEFILCSWELMKARRLQSGATGQAPKVIVLSSSTAFFTPASFALYAASKAYLYSLARSLQVASAPYGVEVVTVTPGFIDTAMTKTMMCSGATTPQAILGDPRKLAKKIRRSEEKGEQVVFYPVSQVCALFSLRALNPLMEALAMWTGAATGVAAWVLQLRTLGATLR
ncbi:hypothetical protein VTI74DRAFT_8341 [Chaetomium olivicolor]